MRAAVVALPAICTRPRHRSRLYTAGSEWATRALPYRAFRRGARRGRLDRRRWYPPAREQAGRTLGRRSVSPRARPPGVRSVPNVRTIVVHGAQPWNRDWPTPSPTTCARTSSATAGEARPRRSASRATRCGASSSAASPGARCREPCSTASDRTSTPSTRRRRRCSPVRRPHPRGKRARHASRSASRRRCSTSARRRW